MGRRSGLLAVALLLLGGCHTHHYLVRHDGAPLYAAPAGQEELARLPAYHHEPLQDAPSGQGERVEVAYRGRRGWVARGDVTLFRYLDPEWDEGADRERTIQRALRSAQVAAEGSGWDSSVREAVVAGEVAEGMTREQVQLAWGWPTTVEPGGRAGGERWIFRVRAEAQVRSLPGWDPWWGCSLGYGWWDDPWCSCGHPGWRWGGCRLHRGAWVRATVPVIEERRVEFDAAGRVVELDVHRWLSEGT